MNPMMPFGSGGGGGGGMPPFIRPGQFFDAMNGAGFGGPGMTPPGGPFGPRGLFSGSPPTTGDQQQQQHQGVVDPMSMMNCFNMAGSGTDPAAFLAALNLAAGGAADPHHHHHLQQQQQQFHPMMFRDPGQISNGATAATAPPSGENDPNKFVVRIDVSQFTPDEVKVKVLDDQQLVIEAEHEEKMDPHGFVARSFKRRYVLPSDVDPTRVVSTWTPGGLLILEARRQVADGQSPAERDVPIQIAVVDPTGACGGLPPGVGHHGLPLGAHGNDDDDDPGHPPNFTLRREDSDLGLEFKA